jgi:serine O-acetyltransferase
MRLNELIRLCSSDSYRYTGKSGAGIFLREYLRNPRLKYTFHMRLCKYFSEGNKKIVLPLLSFILSHYQLKYGISIDYQTQIGYGFYIGHSGCIVVNGRAIIGNNCNLSHGVTIGKANRGARRGYPALGNNVYIGPGAKIIGGIVVGNDVAIGANAVVTGDVPDHAVVAGIPARVLSMKGSEGYISHIDYGGPGQK